MNDTLTPQGLGAVISFYAEVFLQGYAGTTVVSSPTAKVGPRLMSKNLTKPTITGTPLVGNGLETNGGTGEKGVLAVDCQWLREGKPIPEERSMVYYLTEADAGNRIFVQGIGSHSNPGHGQTVVTSSPVTVKAAPNPVPEPTPAPKKKFKGVPDRMQFAKDIQWSTYRPYGLLSRDATSAFMYRRAGSPSYTAPNSSPFRDIVKGQQFYKEMLWLSATGSVLQRLGADPLLVITHDVGGAFPVLSTTSLDVYNTLWSGTNGNPRGELKHYHLRYP